MARSVKANIFLRRPILSTVISLFILLVGGLAIKALPIAQYPDLVPPQVSVTAYYPGASAETIASTVVAPLEVSINGVENMLYMSSVSYAGTCVINVYFKLGTDPDMALVNVNNKVNLATTQLPESVRRQGVTVLKDSPAILMILSMFSPDGRYSEEYIHNYMQTNVVDEIKRLAGVGDCSLFGSMDYAMRIWLQPDKLATYGITPAEISAAIQDQNAQFAPGSLGALPTPDSTELMWQIDTRGRLTEPEEFAEIILRSNPDGSALRLKDVARVELGGKDYSVMTRMDGRPSRMGAVYLLPGANAIETGKLVEAKMRELSRRFPEGMEYAIPLDTNNFVRASINEVIQTLLEAMLLVFVVVFVFLQSWRATLIPCLAVPVSIVGTFAGMYALGYTINTLTLFGMVLAIGIVVDDAIVVLENVERIMTTEHLPPHEATAKAMSEVTGPVIAIVLVLCAVFIPVSFMGGLAGEMYKQFAITISVSVILSGIVALTLTPALCGLLLRPHAPDYRPGAFFRWFDAFFARLTNGYVAIVRWVKDHALLSGGMVVIMVGAMLFLFRVVPTSMVPNEDQGYALGVAILADGAATPRTERVMDQLSAGLMQQPGVRHIVSLTGLDLTSMASKSNYGSFFAILKDWKERKLASESPEALIRVAYGIGMRQPEALILGFTPPPITGMSTTGGFEGYLQNRGSGSNDELQAMANKLVDAALKRPEIGSCQNLFSTGSPQMYANLDRERCRAMGVKISDVFDVMGATFGTSYVNDFNRLGRTFQVRMQSEEEFRVLPESINDVYVRNQGGKMIPLSALMTMERRTAPAVMDRYNVFPSAHILGNPADGYSTGQALQAMEEVAAEVLPVEYSLGWAGSSLQEKLASADTTIIFVLALLMVFLILSAQYESWALPLAVLTAVPFGVFGAVLATWLRSLANDVYFQVALVTLVGLAAKNAILIVEFAVEAWRDGRSLDAAALHASRLRFRPIVMTSLAFILGCVPLAISTGAGANSRHAIGTAVIGGMLAATCLATLFIPFFFKAIMSLSLKLRGEKDPNAGKDQDEEDR